jgi:glycine/D-amino acid oxidase-like deaminating enzyme
VAIKLRSIDIKSVSRCGHSCPTEARSAVNSVVVVGGGVFGAASALELSTRGWRVTLLDPHALPYDGASSTDVSKLVRMDYGSDSFYHELAEAALEGWDRWNADWPRRPYHEDGLLVLSHGPMLPGGFEHESWRVLGSRGHATQRLSLDARIERFPAWRSARYSDGYFNPRAGWAESALVVEQLLDHARAAGVTVQRDGLGALVERHGRVEGIVTASGAKLLADVVLVCAGAWTPALLPWLSDRMWTTAQPVLHMQAPDPDAFRAPVFPPWAADIAGTGWYGFPATADGRVKIGHHGMGERVDPAARGEVSEAHVARTRAFLRESLPDLAEAPVALRRVCLYCDTFDGDFLIDHDPDRDGLVVAGGGSGHAFKFAPVLGPLIADVVERRANRWAPRFSWRTLGESRREEARFMET